MSAPEPYVREDVKASLARGAAAAVADGLWRGGTHRRVLERIGHLGDLSARTAEDGDAAGRPSARIGLGSKLERSELVGETAALLVARRVLMNDDAAKVREVARREERRRVVA